jgi:hypothetical protein
MLTRPNLGGHVEGRTKNNLQRQMKEKPLRMTISLLAYRRLFRKGKINKIAMGRKCRIFINEHILA